MRDMVAVSEPEFQAFLAAYPNSLVEQRIGQVHCYTDVSDGAEWPDNLVASFLPATATRRRSMGWRVAMEQPDAPA